MRKRNYTLRVMTMLAALLLAAVGSAAAQQQDESLEEQQEKIEERLAARYPQLLRQFNRGTIGETWQGYVDIVAGQQATEQLRRLVDQENRDRRELYRVIARKVTPGEEQLSPAQVGQRNARRKFERAKPEHYLKMRDGRWIQKKDMNRHARISKLKQDGRLGETWEGFIGIVAEADKDDAALQALVREENDARRAMYERLKGDREIAIESIAQEAGEEILKNVLPGEYFRARGAEAWEKKEAQAQG